MLNWIDKNERLPTKEDASDEGSVYVLFDFKDVLIASYCSVGSKRITHWLPFREMPIPKRWRPATIHDLAKAGKPIPCRVTDKHDEGWFYCFLNGMSVQSEDTSPFYADGSWWCICEVEDA